MKFKLIVEKYTYDKPDKILEKLGFKFRKVQKDRYFLEENNDVIIEVNTMEELLKLAEDDSIEIIKTNSDNYIKILNNYICRE